MAKWHRSLLGGWRPEACQAVGAPKLARRLVPRNLRGTIIATFAQLSLDRKCPPIWRALTLELQTVT